MKFVKWRTTWAWGVNPSKKGPDKGWYWKTFPDNYRPKDVRAVMEDLAEREGGHSDKFRSIEWKTVKNPPLEVVQKKYSEAVEAVENAKKRETALSLVRDELLQRLKKRTGLCRKHGGDDLGRQCRECN